MSDIVLFDSWAWWEVLEETPAGRVLAERYLEARRVRVLTVDYTLAEVAAKLARIDRAQDIEGALDAISTADMVPITPEIAALAATLQVELRKETGDASVGDAVMLAAARLHGIVLISGDPCYAGQRDVRAS
jgi:predicted nucleic acid-binding protein